MPFYRQQFENLLQRLLQEWWPRDGDAPRPPRRLAGPLAVCIHQKIDRVATVLPSGWYVLGRWFSDEAAKWEAGSFGEVVQVADSLEHVIEVRRAEIAAGLNDPDKQQQARLELAAFDRIVATARALPPCQP